MERPTVVADPAAAHVLLDDEGFPLTAFEVEQLRHTRINSENDSRERRRLRKANRAKGFDEPAIGKKYWVQLDSSVPRRTRAGMRFERNQRVELTVVADDEFDQAVEGAAVITVIGAEHLIEDSAFHVTERPEGAEDIDQLKLSRDQAIDKANHAEREGKRLREENARLAAAMAAMKAGRAAPESKSGEPTKLGARAAARGDTTPEFGTPAETDRGESKK